MDLAEKMANATYSLIAKSCSRMVIGKSFWKGVVLPRILSASAVVDWTMTEKRKLQTTENGVWRQILGAPMYTPVAALQGEVGASSMESRDMKIKMMFAKYMMDTENGLVKEIFEVMREDEKPKRWMRQVRGYLGELQLTWAGLRRMSKKQIKEAINEWETVRWRGRVESRSTLEIYARKVEIKDENMYRNNYGSVILFRCRTNTLKLNWRKRFEGGGEGCSMCGAAEEDLEHFLMRCPMLREVRERFPNLDGYDVGELLLFGECGARDVVETTRFVEEMWSERGRRVRT